MLVAARKARALATMTALAIAAGQRDDENLYLLRLFAWCEYGARDLGARLD